jgi:hypothetical protein
VQQLTGSPAERGSMRLSPRSHTRTPAALTATKATVVTRVFGYVLFGLAARAVLIGRRRSLADRAREAPTSSSLADQERVGSLLLSTAARDPHVTKPVTSNPYLGTFLRLRVTGLARRRVASAKRLTRTILSHPASPSARTSAGGLAVAVASSPAPVRDAMRRPSRDARSRARPERPAHAS